MTFRSNGFRPRVRSRGRVRHKNGRMNKTEARYEAEVLIPALAAGLIQWYKFEAHSIRLADDTFYKPDFSVVAADGTWEEHEVKAWWKSKNGPAWEDDARVKVKVAAENWPAVFKGVSPKPSGEWHVEVF